MNSFNPNYFLHAANVLLLVAYSPEFVLDFIHYTSNSPTQIQAQHVI